MEGEITLKKLLNDIISEYQSEIDNLSKEDELGSKLRKISVVKEDYYTLITIELDLLKEIVNSFDLHDYEKEMVFSELKVVQLLLKLNKEKGTSYELSTNHLESIDKFIEGINYLEKQYEERQRKKGIYIDELNINLNKYLELLNRLDSPDNNVFVDDLDTVNQLFIKKNLDDDIRESILIGLIKHNKNKYNRVGVE